MGATASVDQCMPQKTLRFCWCRRGSITFTLCFTYMACDALSVI